MYELYKINMTYITTHKINGISFNRCGTCNRCGICCKDEQCPHYVIVNNLPSCLIYDKREQKCEECSKIRKKYIDHKICIKFPDHPWLKVIKKKECSYKFIRLDEAGNVSNIPLPFTGINDPDNYK